MGEKKISVSEIEEFEQQLHDLHRLLADELNMRSRQIKEPVDRNFNNAILGNDDKKIVEFEDEMEESQVQMIEDALQRIANNYYGICRDCVDSIPLERLQVIPYAKYCIKCGEKRES